MRPFRLLAVPVLLLAFALAAGSASAENYCVDIAPDPCNGTLMPTIQEALDAAGANKNDPKVDVVKIGDNGGVPYVEDLNYTYGPKEKVDVVGEGPGVTVIEPASADYTFYFLSPNSEVRRLTLLSPESGAGSALKWNGWASEIEVIDRGAPGSSVVALLATGNARLEESVVKGEDGPLYETVDGTHARIINSSFVGGAGAIRSGNEGTLTIESSEVATEGPAIEVINGMTVNVDNTILRSTATEPTADATLEVLSGSAVVRHGTVFGNGFGTGLRVDSSPTNSTLSASSTIVEGFETALQCDEVLNEATLDFTYSNRTDATDIDAGCASVQTGSTTTEPSFVDPIAIVPELALKAPSPLIDAGDPADPLSVDFLGQARVVDGDGIGGARSDMGAFEYQRRAPLALLGIAGTDAPRTVVLSAKGSFDPDPGDTLTYKWDFGDGTTGSGIEVEHKYPANGPYTITLTAIDQTGLSATDSGGVTFHDFDSVPQPPKAVTLSRVRAVPKRIVIDKAKPQLLDGSKAGIRFTISAAAEVTLKLNRCKGRSGCTDLAKVAGSASFAASPGPHTIAFSGRFKGQAPLAPGRYVARLYVEGGSVYSTRFDLIAPH